MCHGVFFSMFLALRFRWTFCICEYNVFTKFGNFPAIISSTFLCGGVLSSFGDFNYLCIWLLEVVPQLTGAMLIIVVFFSQNFILVSCCYCVLKFIIIFSVVSPPIQFIFQLLYCSFYLWTYDLCLFLYPPCFYETHSIFPPASWTYDTHL